jgi:hypothetical protein
VDDALYDEATLRRIDRPTPGQPRRRVARRAGSKANFAGTVSIVTAIGLGLQQVFDPPADEEIVLELDTTGLVDDDQPVTFEYDPTSVRRSRALVRPWLFATIP